ncbi:MAG: endonuclease/exonuclease/phosphatase family protein [Verrucomicrobium sp.]
MSLPLCRSIVRLFVFGLMIAVGHLGAEPPATAAKVELNVVSFNLRNGGRRMDGTYDHALQHRVIRDLKPDLVALQEVDRMTQRVKGVDVPAEFAKALGMEFAFGKAMPYAGGEYGTAALTKFPPVHSQTIPLPVQNGEPRAATLVTVKMSATLEVTLVSVHLDSGEKDAARQINASGLIDGLKEITTPVILAGDFNDGADSATLALLVEAGFRRSVPKGDASTYPADKPTVVIDHLLLRDGANAHLDDAGTQVVPNGEASDHRPLRARLRVTAGRR